MMLDRRSLILAGLSWPALPALAASPVTATDVLGRTVKLREIGVHEIRDGKISIERFYYNPMALAPPS